MREVSRESAMILAEQVASSMIILVFAHSAREGLNAGAWNGRA